MDILIFNLNTPTNYIDTVYLYVLELKLWEKMYRSARKMVQNVDLMVISYFTQPSLFATNTRNSQVTGAFIYLIGKLIGEPGLILETGLYFVISCVHQINANSKPRPCLPAVLYSTCSVNETQHFLQVYDTA